MSSHSATHVWLSATGGTHLKLSLTRLPLSPTFVLLPSILTQQLVLSRRHSAARNHELTRTPLLSRPLAPSSSTSPNPTQPRPLLPISAASLICTRQRWARPLQRASKERVCSTVARLKTSTRFASLCSCLCTRASRSYGGVLGSVPTKEDVNVSILHFGMVSDLRRSSPSFVRRARGCMEGAAHGFYACSILNPRFRRSIWPS